MKVEILSASLRMVVENSVETDGAFGVGLLWVEIKVCGEAEMRW